MILVYEGPTIEDIGNLLEGTWKIENKESYETWHKGDTGNLEGYAYRLIGTTKKVTETLVISVQDGVLTYHATVPNQNDGATILFRLNKSLGDDYSFENPNHDFPKRIIYDPISESEIQVHVLGEDDKGFSYKLIKQ